MKSDLITRKMLIIFLVATNAVILLYLILKAFNLVIF